MTFLDLFRKCYPEADADSVAAEQCPDFVFSELRLLGFTCMPKYTMHPQSEGCRQCWGQTVPLEDRYDG